MLRRIALASLCLAVSGTLCACGGSDGSTPQIGDSAPPETAPFVEVSPMIASPDFTDPFDGSLVLPQAVAGAVVAPSNYEGEFGPASKPNPKGAELSSANGENTMRIAAVDEYRGYDPAVLDTAQGSFEFYFRPAPDVLEVFDPANRPEWRKFGQYDPPGDGMLLDTVGWRAAPAGSYGIVAQFAETASAVTWSIWDGNVWHYVSYQGPAWNAEDWHLITATYGPQGVRLFVDGQLAKEDTTYKGGIDTSQSFFLGQAPWYWPYGPHSMVGEFRGFAYSKTQL